MTAVIGTHFPDGVILCADTRFVDQNGDVSYGPKIITHSDNDGQGFAVACASDDANAGTVLANEMIAALSIERHSFESAIKSCMKSWQADYGQSAVPVLQFLVACAYGGRTQLYFCQPPNVVIPRYQGNPVCIGTAAKIIEALLPIVLMDSKNEGSMDFPIVEPALLKLAYLMYRAKNEDVYTGGNTDVVLVRRDGAVLQPRQEEMREAEEFSKRLDFHFKWCCYGLFSQQSEEEQKAFINRFRESYLYDARQAAKVWFPSLEGWGS